MLVNKVVGRVVLVVLVMKLGATRGSKNYRNQSEWCSEVAFVVAQTGFSHEHIKRLTEIREQEIVKNSIKVYRDQGIEEGYTAQLQDGSRVAVIRYSGSLKTEGHRYIKDENGEKCSIPLSPNSFSILKGRYEKQCNLANTSGVIDIFGKLSQVQESLHTPPTNRSSGAIAPKQ